MRFARPLLRLIRAFLIGTGIAAIVGVVWLVFGLPLFVDRLVIETQPPAKAAAIICLAGGLSHHQLPLDEGWQRIYTAVQLQADGYAPTIVFSGGGTERTSEAEVYAEAARWLGCPREAIALDPFPGGTADHPANLLKLHEPRIRTDTPVLVVTSAFHSKRTAMCFRKAGFTNFRVVTTHEAASPDARVARGSKTSAIEAFRPSGKRYDDPLNRLKWGLDDLLTTVRELAAIAVYKYKGQA